MIDPIADMLTRIRNASLVGKAEVSIPHSKMKEKIADVLHQEGYINSYRVEEHGFKNIIINLKYNNKKPAITSLKMVSRGGRRVYAGKADLPNVLNGLGISIISTSKGIMTSEEARKLGVGGEILCEIY